MAQAVDTAVEAHPSHLRHHFVTSEQQFDAAKMGMWLFLVTEILLFTGMFVAYTVYRAWHPEVFKAATVLLDTFWGALNTIVLLTSSLTVALAIRSIQEGKQKWLVVNLILTILLAFCFLAIKYMEYEHKFHLHIYPGAHYAYPGLDMAYVPIFMSLYFVMTGIHGLHVVIGIGILSWMTIRAVRGEFSAEYYTPVEVSGLYWHLVDIIWIFLFPLLYLI